MALLYRTLGKGGKISGQVSDESQQLHGNGTMIPLETLDCARRLLACEEAAGRTAEATELKEPPALRVYEKLRRSLSALAGVAGFRSLVSRALTLAKADDPSLSAVQVTEEGYLEGLGQRGSRIDDGQSEETGLILIAYLLGLLLTFIGGSLTTRLVQDVWPDAAFEECNSGDGRKV